MEEITEKEIDENIQYLVKKSHEYNDRMLERKLKNCNVQEGSVIWLLSRRPKQRAKVYVDFIYELFQEIPNHMENEVVKDVHSKMMMLPEYREEE